MYKQIVRFFTFVFPILMKAVLEVAADELTRLAHKDLPSKPDNTKSLRKATMDVGRAVREAEEARLSPVARYMSRPPAPSAEKSKGFHDVLMVAFDLTGPNANYVHEWLQRQMPTGDTSYDGEQIHLDSWWVANDERYDGSDTDSAVFVLKGNQTPARELLHKEGLAR